MERLGSGCKRAGAHASPAVPPGCPGPGGPEQALGMLPAGLLRLEEVGCHSGFLLLKGRRELCSGFRKVGGRDREAHQYPLPPGLCAEQDPRSLCE